MSKDDDDRVAASLRVAMDITTDEHDEFVRFLEEVSGGEFPEKMGKVTFEMFSKFIEKYSENPKMIVYIGFLIGHSSAALEMVNIVLRLPSNAAPTEFSHFLASALAEYEFDRLLFLSGSVYVDDDDDDGIPYVG